MMDCMAGETGVCMSIDDLYFSVALVGALGIQVWYFRFALLPIASG